jgi:hypothetical protein
MGGLIAIALIGQQFENHVAKARHRPNRRTVAFPRQRRQAVKGAEDVTRAINKGYAGIGAYRMCHGVILGQRATTSNPKVFWPHRGFKVAYAC